MRVLLDLGAFIAVLLLGYLFYLVLFERGALYRTSSELHGLGDQQRLRLLSALLGTPPQSIDSCRVLREGPELYDVQLAAIAVAKRSIHLEAYIYYPGRIGEALRAALCERARDGVHVRVVIDAIGSLRLPAAYFDSLIAAGGPYSDHGLVRRAGRRRYGVLLEAGVEIAEYNSRMMHAKVLLVDGRWALLGSTNIDSRSFGLNDEVNLLVLSADLATQLRETFEEDLRQSRVIDLAAWLNRSWGERLLATLGRALERHQ